MTDIVERLRAGVDELYWEAADEIERLRAAMKAIERRTAASTRTFDGMIKDMGLANDLARAALGHD